MKFSVIEPLESRIAPASLTPTVSIAGPSSPVVKGTSAVFVVTLNEALAYPMTVSFNTMDGPAGNAAAAGTNYTAELNQTVTFPAGVTTEKVYVPVLQDHVLDHVHNQFGATISNPTDTNNDTIQLGTATATANIVVDPLPTATVNNVGVLYTTSNTTAVFDVHLSMASDQAVTFNYTTMDASAQASTDYTLTAGVGTIAAGGADLMVSVPVLGTNTASTVVKSFNFQVSPDTSGSATTTGANINVSNNPTGVATIIPSALAGVSLTGPTGPVVKGQNAVFTVTLLSPQPLGYDVTVTFNTGLAGDTAVAGTNYTAESETVTIPAGQISQSVTVPVLQDNVLDHVHNTFGAAITNAVELDPNSDSLPIITATATANIVVDPLPTVSISPVSGPYLAGGSTVTFDVHLSMASDQAVTFNYATMNGTAMAGTDYTATSGMGTIAADSTNDLITVPVLAATGIKASTNFTLQVTPDVLDTTGNNVNFGSPATPVVGMATLYTPATISLAGPSSPVTKGSNAVFTATLNETFSYPVTFSFSTGLSTDSAVAGVNYTTETNVTETIPAGSTSTTFSVPVLMDTVMVNGVAVPVLDHIHNTFGVTISNAVEQDPTMDTVIINNATTTANIVVDPLPTVTIAPVSAPYGTSGSSHEVFDVHLSLNGKTVVSDQKVTFDYATMDGTAISTGMTPDYTATMGVGSITNGSTDTTVTVPITGNTAVKADTQFYLDVTPDTVNATGANLQFPVNPVVGVGTIYNDKSLFEIVNDANSSTNVITLTKDISLATFRIVRTGDTSLTSTVQVMTVDGTGTDGGIGASALSSMSAPAATATAVDYASYTYEQETLTFAPGQVSETISIPILNTDIYTGNEHFTVQLSNAHNAGVASTASLNTGIVDIEETVSAPAISISNGVAAEGGMVDFKLSLSRPSAVPITVNYVTANGTATASSGAYTAESETATFAAGSTTADILVPTTAGDLGAGNLQGNFTLTLSAPSAGSLANATATGTILSASAPELFISNAALVKGDNGVMDEVFTVALSKAGASDITVKYATANNTVASAAAAGTDYTPENGALTFAAGTTTLTQTIVVPVDGNMIQKGNLSFLMNLSGATGATILQSQATGTIYDTDVAVNVSNPTITASKSGTVTEDFAVSLNQPLTGSNTLSINFNTLDGVASGSAALSTGGSLASYSANGSESAPGKLTFNSTTQQQTVAISINAAQFYANPEMYYLVLSDAMLGSETATLTSHLGTGTIVSPIANAAPTISVTPVATAVSAGSSAGTASFTVTLSEPLTHAVTVPYTYSDTYDQATPMPTAGSVTIAAGATSATISVPYDANNGKTLDQTANVTLQAPSLVNPLNDTILTANPTIAGSATAKTLVYESDTAISIGTPTAAVMAPTTAGKTTTLIFPVTLAAPLDHNVTINYSTANGTALAGTDYAAATGSVTILAGQTTPTTPLAITIDGNPEFAADETFSVTLGSFVGAAGATVSTGTAAGTITHSTSLEPHVSVSNLILTKGNSGTFTVTLDKPAETAITISYSSQDDTPKPGTTYNATAGTNYTGTAVGGDQTVTIAAGSTSATLYANAASSTPFMALDDHTNDPQLDFNLVIDGATVNGSVAGSTISLSPSGSSTPISTTHTLTAEGIINPTLAQLPTLSISNATVTETGSGTAMAQFTVSMNVPATDTTVHPVTFYATTLKGTALPGTAAGNYTALMNAPFTIPAGSTSAVVDVPIIGGNANYFANTNFSVQIAVSTNPALANATVVSGIGTGTIVTGADTFSIQASKTSTVSTITVEEDHTKSDAFATFTVVRNGDTSHAASVFYSTEPGTAVATGAFPNFQTKVGELNFAAGQSSQTISIPVYNHNGYNGATNESFTVALSSPSGGSIANGVGTVSILDNNPAPTVSISAPAAIMKGSSGSQEMIFTVKLSEPNYSAPVTIDYATADGAVSGSTFGRAIAGTNYESVSNSITFAPGQTSQTIDVVELGNKTYEGWAANEGAFHVTLTLPTGSTAATLGATTAVNGLIIDTTPEPVVSITPKYSAKEGQNEIFTVSLANPSAQTVTVEYYTIDGTAISTGNAPNYNGIPFQNPQSLTFNPGQTSQSVVIATLSPPESGASTSFEVALESPTNASLAPKASFGTGTILNTQTSYLTINNATVNETKTKTDAIFTVSLSEPSTSAVTFSYATLGSGTAVSGVNFIAESGTLTIPAGQTSTTIDVPIPGGSPVATAASTGSFSVQLSNPVNASILSGTGNGTISYNDPVPTLNIQDSYVVSQAPSSANPTGDTTITFTPTLTAAALSNITFTLSTAAPPQLHNVAVAGADYKSKSETFTIDAGQTQPSSSFTVTIPGTNVFRPMEQFAVVASGLNSVQDVGNVIGGKTTAIGSILNSNVYISAQTASWEDTDGDLVTLHVSEGNLLSNPSNILQWSNQAASGASATAVNATTGGRALQVLDLWQSGVMFLDANVTITAVKQVGFPTNIANPSYNSANATSSANEPFITPNGLVNVGAIYANNLYQGGDPFATQGIDLGAVTVKGDLGQIYAGDLYNFTGLVSLNVHSLGYQNFLSPINSTNPSSLQSEVIAGIGSLNVTTNLAGFLDVVGSNYGFIHSLNVGTLLGGTLQDEGLIVTSGAIGTAKLGTITGGATSNTGEIAAFSIGNINVTGSVTGGAGTSSGVISSTTSIGVVKIGGNLDNSGGVGPGTASVQASTIGSATVHGSILGGSIIAFDSIKSVTVGQDLSGVTYQGPVNTDGTTPSPVNIPTVIAAAGVTSASGNAASAIGSVTIDGSTSDTQILGGYEASSSASAVNGVLGINAEAQIGTVKIIGNVTATDIVAGAAADSNGLFGASASDNQPISGGLTGSTISKIAKVIIDGQISADSTGDVHGIVAAYVGSVVVDGAPIALTAAKDYLPVPDPSTNFYVEEIP